MPKKTMPSIALFAGFGDGAEMFSGLHKTELASRYHLLPYDLPGCASSAPLSETTTLMALADFVDGIVRENSIEIVVGHSVASMIAALAAQKDNSPIHTILSLEGNLIDEDGYFTGLTIEHDNASSFREAFLKLIEQRFDHSDVYRRYYTMIEMADPVALWELGINVTGYAKANKPGKDLTAAPRAVYFYNPKNCKPRSIEWLNQSELEAVIIDEASHWASVDQPDRLSQAILDILEVE